MEKEFEAVHSERSDMTAGAAAAQGKTGPEMKSGSARANSLRNDPYINDSQQPYLYVDYKQQRHLYCEGLLTL